MKLIEPEGTYPLFQGVKDGLDPLGIHVRHPEGIRPPVFHVERQNRISNQPLPRRSMILSKSESFMMDSALYKASSAK